MYQKNIEGTHLLLQYAGDAGVEKIVYTSSITTLDIHAYRTTADEDSPVCLDDMIGHYKRSKYLAEEEVHNLIAAKQLPATIVNSTTPIGPRDIKPTPTGHIIVDCLAEKYQPISIPA